MLMCAARHGRSQVANLLLKFGAEIDTQDKVLISLCLLNAMYVPYSIKTGSTALCMAAQAGQVSTVKSLLEAGADLNIQKVYMLYIGCVRGGFVFVACVHC